MLKRRKNASIRFTEVRLEIEITVIYSFNKSLVIWVNLDYFNYYDTYFSNDRINNLFVFSSNPGESLNFLLNDGEDSRTDYLADYLERVYHDLISDVKLNSTMEYSIPGRFSTFDGNGFNFYLNPMFIK